MVPAAPIESMQVLIADDQRDSAETLATLIRSELGCQVVTAYDGKQALDLALGARRDVLILDLQMPGMSGLEVAVAARASAGGARPPLLLAMSGRNDLEGELAVIDVRFDRAFAKPVDVAALLATLRSHWDGDRAIRPAEKLMVLEALTHAARQVQPLLDTKGLHLSFDAEGPDVVLLGHEASLVSAFYRQMCGVLDLLYNGIVLVTAYPQQAQQGDRQTMTVCVAGSGQLEGPTRTFEVMQRLGLTSDAGDASQHKGSSFMQAHGTCPNSGGVLTFASHPTEGVLLRLELAVQPSGHQAPSRVEDARAWIVDARNVEPAALERRLQRMGWQVWRFPSPEAALERIAAQSGETLPDALLVGVDLILLSSHLAALSSHMPQHTRCWLLQGAGSEALIQAVTLPRWETRVEPLSPVDLARAGPLASDAEATTAMAGATTSANSLRGRRKVLVVDDVEINRIVAGGLLQLLGYEVAAVADGLDAIEYCKRTPPDVVLMDVNMPVLGGIDASRRIVELQKTGQIAPFAIIVATADDAPETKARCVEAGVRAYLYKPLRLEAMRHALRQVGFLEATR